MLGGCQNVMRGRLEMLGFLRRPLAKGVSSGRLMELGTSRKGSVQAEFLQRLLGRLVEMGKFHGKGSASLGGAAQFGHVAEHFG
jgi:hypothetical protein